MDNSLIHYNSLFHPTQHLADLEHSRFGLCYSKEMWTGWRRTIKAATVRKGWEWGLGSLVPMFQCLKRGCKGDGDFPFMSNHMEKMTNNGKSLLGRFWLGKRGKNSARSGSRGFSLWKDSAGASCLDCAFAKKGGTRCSLRSLPSWNSVVPWKSGYDSAQLVWIYCHETPVRFLSSGKNPDYQFL